MKILIIGSKGFIGSYAFSYFTSRPGINCWGCDVVVDYPATNYFLLDTTNSDFNELFTEMAFDVCINCSGAASVNDSMDHPLRDFSLNTFNVIKILDAIRRHAPACRFINLSSAAVYGNPVALPIKETDACGPLSPYGKHKLFAEELCGEYYRYFNVATCSLRIFSAYGPGLKKQILWDIFKKSGAAGPVQLFGTGRETRDFIYVADIIAAIDLIIQKGAFDASVYNLASGIETSMRELAELFLKEIGYRGELVFSGNERAGDPINWRADTTKLTALGFEPAILLETGIKNYIKWLGEEKLV
ncbi:MAG: GDP-mannose 4,6-dehydratase [Ferruginibacter sp.]|nr:GDP-mannose 4,6-dehydratase [Ferruginibacter sp.]